MRMFLTGLLFVILLLALDANAQFKPSEQQYLEQTNLAFNNGFEQGLRNWTNANGVFSIDSTNFVLGKKSGKVALTAQTLDFSQTLSTGYNSALASLQGHVAAYVKADFPFQVCALIDGVETNCVNGSGDNKFDFYDIPIVLGSTSLGIKFKSLTNYTGSIYIDGVEYGHKQFVSNVAQSEFIGSIHFSDNNCQFNRTSASYGTLTSGSACSPNILSSNLSFPNTTEMGIQINNAKVGTYRVEFQGLLYNSSNTNTCRFSMSTTSGYENQGEVFAGTGSGGNRADNTLVGNFEVTTEGDLPIKIIGYNTGGNECRVYGTTSDQSRFNVYYHPPESQIVRQNRDNWFVDVNIGGDNPQQGTGNVSSYSELTANNLDMVVNEGSDTNVEIPCSGVNPSNGLTCSASSESVGVVFTPPRPDYYDICFYGSVYRPVANSVTDSTYKLIETPNNAQTILQEGKTTTSHGYQDQGSGYSVGNLNNCSTFKFNDTNEKTIRLMFEQTVAGPGTIQAPQLIGDRAATLGQREMRITVRPSLKSGVIVGEFEQIKTTELAVVEAVGNTGQAISSNTTDVPFTETSDPFNLWDGDSYELRQDGCININGSIRLTSAGSFNTNLFVNTVFNKTIADAMVSSSQFNAFSGIYCGSEGDIVSLRINTNQNLTNDATKHHLTITELPDVAAIVKNLNDNKSFKQQTKETTAAYGVGQVSELEFNNLEIGKRYRIALHGTVFLQLGSDSSIQMQYEQNGTAVKGTFYRVRDQVPSGSALDANVERVVEFTATHSDLILNITASGGSGVEQLKVGAVATLTELPDNYVDTTQF